MQFIGLCIHNLVWPWRVYCTVPKSGHCFSKKITSHSFSLSNTESVSVVTDGSGFVTGLALHQLKHEKSLVVRENDQLKTRVHKIRGELMAEKEKLNKERCVLTLTHLCVPVSFCVYTLSIGNIETVNYHSVLCKLFCTTCKLMQTTQLLPKRSIIWPIILHCSST